MAGNTFEIKKIKFNHYYTIVTCNGCVIKEYHLVGLSDHDILSKFNKKYYKNFPGNWTITFPHEHKIIKDPDVSKAVDMALEYIYEREHPEEPDYFS